MSILGEQTLLGGGSEKGLPCKPPCLHLLTRLVLHLSFEIKRKLRVSLLVFGAGLDMAARFLSLL